MKKLRITDTLIGLIFTLCIISFSIIITLNLRCLYYFDIDYLNIVESSGLDKNTIINNYNVLIDYNSPFFKGSLKFPDLPSSLEGLQHFIDVKNIFTSIYYIAGITFIVCIIIIVYKMVKKDYSYLFVSSVVNLLILTMIGIAGFSNFDTAFVIFHKIVFQNDFWLFDPASDPIITLLPDTFFLHSLLLIFFLAIIGSFILFIVYRYLKAKKKDSQSKKPC